MLLNPEIESKSHQFPEHGVSVKLSSDNSVRLTAELEAPQYPRTQENPARGHNPPLPQITSTRCSGKKCTKFVM